MRDRVDVLIVGLGPVGATLANLLGRYGVSVLAIDAAPAIFPAPRAIALDDEALRILQLAGLPEGSFPTIAIPEVRMRSPLLGDFARACTAGQSGGHPKLVTFCQPELEAALQTRLREHPSVRFARGIAATAIEQGPDSVRVGLRLGDGTTTTVDASYVVGCDGACSLVRKWSGLDFRGRTYAQDWLIADVRGVRSPIDHVEFFCDPRRPYPHMPAPGGRERWEFMLRPGETREEMERPETIRELLQPWTGDEDVDIERVAVYRFHARVADRFSAGRVHLAGDAAHITPPFAGQGLVAGLRDAANLAWKLAWALKRRASPAILDSYDKERRPHAKATVRLARLLGKIIMPRNLIAAFVVHGLVRLLQLFPLTRRLFSDLEIKPSSAFRRGLFRRRRGRERLSAGALFPQALVSHAGEIKLSDEVLGPRACLVGFGADPAAFVGASEQSAWQSAGGHFLQICHRGQALNRAPPSERCEDLTGTFVPKAAPVGWAAVVRPDRRVMIEGPVEESSMLLREALAMLGAPAQARPNASAVFARVAS